MSFFISLLGDGDDGVFVKLSVFGGSSSKVTAWVVVGLPPGENKPNPREILMGLFQYLFLKKLGVWY